MMSREEYILLVWQNIPGRADFYLIPKNKHDSKFIDLLKKSNRFYINSGEVNPVSEQAATELLNMDLSQYKVDSLGKLCNDKAITSFYTTGIYTELDFNSGGAFAIVNCAK